MGWFENKSGLYRISREVSKQIENELKYTGYKYIHQGMYIIEIKGMTRKKVRNKSLNHPIR